MSLKYEPSSEPLHISARRVVTILTLGGYSEARFQAAAMLVATSSVYTIFAGVQGVIWTDCFQVLTPATP